jgi:hypothetical protein
MLNFLDDISDYSDPSTYALMMPSAMSKPWGAREGGLNLWPTNWGARGGGLNLWPTNQNYFDDLERLAMEPLADASTAAQSTMNVRLDKDSNTYIVEVSLPRLCAVDLNPKKLLARESHRKLRAGAYSRRSPRRNERRSG